MGKAIYGLQDREINILNSEMDVRGKSKLIAFLLWFFLGALGAHRFYSKNTTRAIFMLITLGGLGVWALIDGFFIFNRINTLNEKLKDQIAREIKLNRN